MKASHTKTLLEKILPALCHPNSGMLYCCVESAYSYGINTPPLLPPLSANILHVRLPHAEPNPPVDDILAFVAKK